MMESKKLLVTTDFSEVSFAALEYAAKMNANQVTVLSVVQTGDVPPGLVQQMPNPNAVQAFRDSVQQQTEQKLAELVKKHFIGGADVKAVAIVGSDEPASDICKYANEHEIDVIVMTGQGRGAMESLFVGSTVQKVLRVAKSPVLVVPKR